MKTITLSLIRKLMMLLPVYAVLLVGQSTVLSGQGWHKFYDQEVPSTYPTVAYSMDCTSDSVVVLAVHETFTTNTGLETTSREFCINQNGTVQWSNWLSDSTLYRLNNEVFSTSDNGFLILGSQIDYSNTSKPNTLYITKINQDGIVEWDSTYANASESRFLSIVETPDGGYLYSSLASTSGLETDAYVMKIDSLGTVLWDKSYGDRNYGVDDLIVNNENSYSIVGRAIDNQTNNLSGFIMTIDSIGTVLWDSIYGENQTWSFMDVVKTETGGFMVLGFEGGANDRRPLLVKIDSLGNMLWSRTYAFTSDSHYSKIVPAHDGYIVSIPGNSTSVVMKVDKKGNVVWYRENIDGKLYDLASPYKGVYYFCGHKDNTHQIIRLDESGNTFDNYLTGKVVYDTNLNCAIDSLELELKNWVVEAVGADTTYYGLTDASGNYSINLDTGNYTLQIVPPAPIWLPCTPKHAVFVQLYDTINTNFTPYATKDCPYLTVDVSIPFLRHCTQNDYYVSYCNVGPVSTPNATIEISFPPFIHVLSSSVPWSSQSGNLFTFLLDTLNTGDCGLFTITVEPDCDSLLVGQTICVEAHISPDAICVPSGTSWDGSITDLDVTCNPDSVIFTIKNTGAGNMSTPLNYLVFEDDLLMKSGQFQHLTSQNSLIAVPTNGSTYRLYAEQSPGHFPTNYHPTIAYEGCGTNADGTFSTGYITMFQENDVLEQVSVDCQELVGPYDPNDKRAEPAGYGVEHYIDVGDDLEYHIRFQNVGSDTAFLVVIRDTISPYLDIGSLQLGGSSFPYELEVINSNILVFTFYNIKLVDSTTNEPESHGFVKFKIGQVPKLPIGTVINNQAGIYFDFNEPVITNETYHEIGQDYIRFKILTEKAASKHPELSIKVMPNPFTSFADFVLKGAPEGEKTFELYDTMGRLIHVEQFSEEQRYRLHKSELNSGIYFYKVYCNGKPIISGKLMAVSDY